MPSTDVGDGNVFKLTVVDDAWIDDTTPNHNSDTFLSIGKRAGSRIKRALLKFQDLSINDCEVKKIRWAKLYMYYFEAYTRRKAKLLPKQNNTPTRSKSILLKRHGPKVKLLVKYAKLALTGTPQCLK